VGKTDLEKALQVLMEGRKDDNVNDPRVRQLYLGEDFRM
jgi:ABC-type lipopolysaccharide export system ATPase subunit